MYRENTPIKWLYPALLLALLVMAVFAGMNVVAQQATYMELVSTTNGNHYNLGWMFKAYWPYSLIGLGLAFEHWFYAKSSRRIRMISIAAFLLVLQYLQFAPFLWGYLFIWRFVFPTNGLTVFYVVFTVYFAVRLVMALKPVSNMRYKY